jgi:hypothetical protein
MDMDIVTHVQQLHIETLKLDSSPIDLKLVATDQFRSWGLEIKTWRLENTY